MKRAEGDKGIKLLRYVDKLLGLMVINVYEDRDTDIASYVAIRNQIPENIEYNIYVADNGTLALTESSRGQNRLELILERIRKLK